jgi:hypothetical protein
MTIATPATSVLSQFTGSTSVDYDLMIGVGLDKDSDAVFFQYVGDEGKYIALTVPTSGKPLQQFKAVRLSKISIAEDIGTFHSTKLNVYLESTEGAVVMVTSGLTTMWSQCVITALMGLYGHPTLTMGDRFTFWSKKGDQGMRPSFASIFIDSERIGDNEMYTQLAEARGDKAFDKIEAIMRDSVSILDAEVNGVPADVSVLEELRALPAADQTPDF